ncbi:MAG: helix-hairpin-helix domain-containing protein [Candidatus Muirbacterium halophilum]|nr:helix-hairpin-helix domain-containing protein [Candidatus Muirbacterium halophilum]MCK9475798.1 helix-hairpin-helix domain-containing protein [Candidatus Muirbacterium halophilum]
MKKIEFITFILFIFVIFSFVEIIDSQESLIPVETVFKNNKIEKSAIKEKLNIAFFTESNLIKIKGIGEKLASLILLHFKKGDIKVIDDIQKIKGIGKVKFSKIKEAYEIFNKQ